MGLTLPLHRTLHTIHTHRCVHKIGVFGSVRWSADEETLLYVAESKDNMSKSYFDTSADKDSSPDKSAELKSDEKFAPYVCETTLISMFIIYNNVIY